MESFVSRSEFENVVQDLKKLKGFLLNTFGSKFSDFSLPNKCNDAEQSTNVEYVAEPVIRNTSSQQSCIQLDIPDPLQLPSINSESGVQESNDLPRIPIVTSTISLAKRARKRADASNRHANNGTVPSTRPGVVPIFTGPRLEPKNYAFDGQRNRITDCITIDDDDQDEDLVSGPFQKNGVPCGETLKSPVSLAAPPFLRNTSSNSTESLNSLTPSNQTSNGISTNGIKRGISRLSSLRRSSSKLQKPSAKAGDKQVIQCDECQLFIYSSQHEEHMKTHSVLDAKVLERCSAVFQQAYTCPVCHVQCNDFTIYESHCSISHPNNKPCPVCGKVLSAKKKLRRHMLIHENVRFPCEICGKSYNRSDNLTAHYKTHASATPSIFYCPLCNLAFSSKNGRDDHLESGHNCNGIGNEDMSVSQNVSSAEITNNSMIISDGISRSEIKIDSGPSSLSFFEFEGDGDIE